MEWKNYISRKKRIRNQKRQKHLEEADINIPLLIKFWPSAIIEIIKHVEHNELIRLRSVSSLMKSYVDQEIKIRRQNGFWHWLSYNEMKYIYNTRYERWYPLTSQYYNDYRKFRKYIKNINKCICDDWFSGDYDPDCPVIDIHNYWISETELDKRMIQDSQLDLQLNPKLKFIKM